MEGTTRGPVISADGVQIDFVGSTCATVLQGSRPHRTESRKPPARRTAMDLLPRFALELGSRLRTDSFWRRPYRAHVPRLCLPHPHRRGPVGAAFAANGRRRLVEGEEVHAGAAGCRCSPSVIAARPPCQYTSMIVLSVNTAISSVVSVASICSGTTHKLGSWNSQTHSNPVTTAKQLPRLTGSSAVTPST